MKFTILIYAIFGLILLSSCKKENLVINTVEEEEIIPVVSGCDLVVDIIENSDETFTAKVSGGMEPFTYLWTTRETTETINSNISNAYSVTVTDALNCTSIGDKNIISLCDSITWGFIAGGITVCSNIDGGTEPYNYIWNTGETTTCINPIANGTVSCTITDANDCKLGFEVGYTKPNFCTSFSASISETSAGTLSLNTSNGSGPFSYIWSTGETTKTISVLNNGIYSATVIDNMGCASGDQIIVNLPGACQNFTANFTDNIEVENLGIIISGGTAPYSYSWSNGETSNSTSILNSDNYAVTVIDSEGCIFTMTTVAIKVNKCKEFETEIVEDSPGSLIALAAGGIEPYSYLWSTGEISQNILVTEPGIYRVRVQDDVGCERSAIIEY